MKLPAVAPYLLSPSGRCCLAVLSGLLVGLPFHNAAFFASTWLAFVPLLFALKGVSLRAAYGLGVLAGLGWYLLATPWIVDFLVLFKGLSYLPTLALSLLFWLYSAQLLASLALAYRASQRFLQLPDLLSFPLLTVAAYASFPMLFGVRLGESQSEFLSAIQAVALTGVYGLDFVIALSNVLIYRMLSQPRLAWRQWSTGSALALLVAWFGYGLVTLQQWDGRIADWSSKTIGLVQPRDAPERREQEAPPGYSHSFPPELEMTGRLAAAGAQLVLWPEGRSKRYFDDPQVAAAYRREVERLGVALLLQDNETTASGLRYNNVIALNEAGEASAVYRKMKLVAFGEALPAAVQVPGLEEPLRDYFDLDFRGIEAGTERRRYELAGMNLIPLICYEVLFPAFSAEGFAAQPEGSVLVAVSSNGWFGDSRQPYQHAGASVLRAVENRVPLVHVINHGPSLAVLPNGRQVFNTELGEQGGFVFDLPYSADVGGSFFTQYPRLFLGAVHVALVLILVIQLARRRARASTLAADY